jgi:hypothetical protein
MPKGHSDLPARIEKLESALTGALNLLELANQRLGVLERQQIHYQEYFQRGHFPPGVRADGA